MKKMKSDSVSHTNIHQSGGRSTNKGLVAFIDILGFSDIISNDERDLKFEKYTEIIIKCTSSFDHLDCILFSDTILITSYNTTTDGLKELILTTSKLLYLLIEMGIPIRGCISYGDLRKSDVENKQTIVYGRAIMDAYYYEEKQDWVGIMLSPRVVEKFFKIENLQSMRRSDSMEGMKLFKDKLPWPFILEKCNQIPFKKERRDDPPYYGAYVVLPSTEKVNDPSKFSETLKSFMEYLSKLEIFAPDPKAQQKYKNTITWISSVRNDSPKIFNLNRGTIWIKILEQEKEERMKLLKKRVAKSSKSELIEMCNSRNIDSKGLKVDLRKRLLACSNRITMK